MATHPTEANIAAIVVTYFTGPVLLDCLDRLMADPAVGELIVVDNGNPPQMSAALRARVGGRLTLIAGQGNVGFARACNLGAVRAQAKYLAFLNPDVLIEPGALGALVEAGAGRPYLWCAGARLLWPDGREQRGARRDRITLWSSFVAGLGLRRLGFRDPHRDGDPVPTEPTAVGAVSGAALLLPTEHFHRLGGFDERYFLHVEDIDLCRRIEETGGTVIFQPAARVLHQRSTSQVSALKVEAAKAAGLRHYFFKFARTPLDYIGAAIATPFLYAMLLSKGALRDLARAVTRP